MEEQNASSSTMTRYEGLESIEQKIIALAREKPKGISDKDLAASTPDLKPDQRANIINKLLTQGYFDLFQQANSLYYRLKDPIKFAKCVDNEEKIVFKIIEEAGNKGIWIRDIKIKSNLMIKPLEKILKSLETNKVVKVVKPVAASKKKVYMLYNLEPDESVTGGAWYQDQDFETEFVDVLNQQCYRFLEQKREKAKNCNTGPIAARNMTYASSKDVLKYISDLGISKVKLTVTNIEVILNTLIYDGKIERTSTSDGNNLYRAIQPVLSSAELVKIPCGLCPVRRECHDKGFVTPIKCQYIKEWLE
ncbi:PREDICTED: probable DNA-directed RNA polymerase III subunit RPC6 [Cyphomyrmex costatus]|uniref:DNA-directed RNA polymerase III subunit RPC6 n=1 Tax=Cyphomyrmex costatus TaxID=456900 RepID=A0A195CUS1_9HYME|nr:PREDICTED: probable DNA-directed RNA polymerase III subunit RPC6 [Cyphomyrmex costatus]KYN04431.1 DNA-directed RNA polymerase III subunit RPC6 [Cyphomyrmex costatus]